MEAKFGKKIGKFIGSIYYALDISNDLYISLVWGGILLFQNFKIPATEWNMACTIVFSIEQNMNSSDSTNCNIDTLLVSKDIVNKIIQKISENNELGTNIATSGVQYNINIYDFNNLLINTIILIYFGIIENNEHNGFLIICDGISYGEEASNFNKYIGSGDTLLEWSVKFNEVLDNPFVCYVCDTRSNTTMSTCLCGLITYCTKECQVKDWGRHKALCPKSKKNIKKASIKSKVKTSVNTEASLGAEIKTEAVIACCSNLNCTKAGILQCTNCKCTKYCSRECQKENWKKHKKVCNSLKK